MSDDQLKRYLEAVEKVRAEKAGALDTATRLEIAREIGISDEELAAARAEGEADLVRGEGFLASKLWDEAARSLEEADALLPDDNRVLHGLARALAGRRRAGDTGRARALARRCLELDPRHQPSFALLRELGRPRLDRRIVVAGCVLLFGGTIAYAVATDRHGPRPSASRCAEGQRYCALPAELRPGPGLEEIAFMPAVLNIGPDTVRLDVGGRLAHRAATELELLRLEVALLGDGDKRLGSVALDAQPAFAPPLRAGDSHPFYESLKVPPDTRRAEVTVAERRETPAAGAYGEGKEIALSYEPEAPSHFKLRAVWRARTQRFYQGKSTVEGVVEITNAGDGVIRQLALEIRARDAAGAPLGAGSKQMVAYAHMLPMAPGERRLCRAFVYLSGQIAGESIVVTEVQ